MTNQKKIQAKHVPQDKILAVLRKTGRTMTHWCSEDIGLPPDPAYHLLDALPELRVFPLKVLLAALDAMVRRGEIEGCSCGCRGDWRAL